MKTPFHLLCCSLCFRRNLVPLAVGVAIVGIAVVGCGGEGNHSKGLEEKPKQTDEAKQPGTAVKSTKDRATCGNEGATKQIKAGGICMSIDEKTGGLAGMSVVLDGTKEWTRHPGEVVVRDDLLRRTYTTEDLEHVGMSAEAGRVHIKKTFRGAPWTLDEIYSQEPDCICWDAKVVLPKGDFRSIAIRWEVPMPKLPYSWQVWTARHDMPKDLCKTSSEELEYAEPTSGTLIPAFAMYLPQDNWGFAVCKPFGFRTPCLRFGFGLRDARFRVIFEHLALSQDHHAAASLLFHGTPGCWRPALGWLVGRYPEYFESQCKLLPGLWGGHNGSGFDQTEEEIAAGAAAGERRCEIHGHFPFYGQYDAQQDRWISIRRAREITIPGIAGFKGPLTESQYTVSLEKVRDTIARLNKHGIAALPYIQVAGDASPAVAERFKQDEIREITGERVAMPECGTSTLVQMNADDGMKLADISTP